MKVTLNGRRCQESDNFEFLLRIDHNFSVDHAEILEFLNSNSGNTNVGAALGTQSISSISDAYLKERARKEIDKLWVWLAGVEVNVSGPSLEFNGGSNE